MIRENLGLFNYRYNVSKVLPGIFKKGDDGSFEEELTFCLYERDELEHEDLTVEELAELKSLDLKLLDLADDIVRMGKDILISWRVRNKVPRSHWWWYLDELSEQEIRKLEEKLGKVA